MNEFDNVVERRGTGSTKWSKYKEDVLPFWVADMDFRAPGFIRDALQKQLDHGVFGYSETPRALIDAAVAWLEDEFDWVVAPEWLVWLPGVVPGLNLACRAVGAAGDSVMMNVPVYYPFLAVPGHWGRTPIEVPLVLDRKRWVMDVDAMTAALGNRTRLFMFCNPQNPSGRIYERDELIELAKFCERHDLLICSDEIHCDLRLDDRPHVPIASLSDEIAARTITLMAPTKTYNTPGLCCAFAVIPDAALRRRFWDARGGLVPSVGMFAYTAALAAYEDPSDWLDRLRALPARQSRRAGNMRWRFTRRFDDARRRHLSRVDRRAQTRIVAIRCAISNRTVWVCPTARSFTVRASFVSTSVVLARRWTRALCDFAARCLRPGRPVSAAPTAAARSRHGQNVAGRHVDRHLRRQRLMIQDVRSGFTGADRPRVPTVRAGVAPSTASPRRFRGIRTRERYRRRRRNVRPRPSRGAIHSA